MRTFIYGARNGIHIIDLDQTARLFQRAFNFVTETVARGGHILMIGTKRQATRRIVQEEAARSGSYFIVNRWLPAARSRTSAPSSGAASSGCACSSA